MSFFGRGNENNRTGADSAYRVPIKNALGLDKNDSLVKLKLTALKDPSEYAKDRQEAFKAVVSASVDKVYDQIARLPPLPTHSHIKCCKIGKTYLLSVFLIVSHKWLIKNSRLFLLLNHVPFQPFLKVEPNL